MAKARVLKRAGDPLGAAQMMEEARSLDGQDRFLNGKAAKYWLRAGEVKKATELLALFTKVSSATALRSPIADACRRISPSLRT
jgi:peptide alpha-N-acetyltransferase